MSITDRAHAYEKATSPSDIEFWKKVLNRELCFTDNMTDEYNGIDATSDGAKLQLKLRETDYNDFLIEFANGDSEKGWINKKQTCDYLIMGWRPSQTYCCVKWSELKQAWDENHFDWFEKLGTKSIKMGKNILNGKKQVTFNLAVPFYLLEHAGITLIKTK